MNIGLYTMVSVGLVSAISLVGVFTLSLNASRLKEIVLFLVSFAAGGLFGDAFIHLIPESFEKLGPHLATSLAIIIGILIFFILEKFLRWQHCHIPTSQAHLHPVVTLNLIGDAVHNLIDGMIIAASYSVSIPIGITTTLAVIFHEIPQEIGDFGVLIHGGLSIKKALTFNFLSALTACAGAVLILLMGPFLKEYIVYLMPITAGGFLYIAGSDLIPELHHDVKLSRSAGQFFFMILGIGIMAAMTLLE